MDEFLPSNAEWHWLTAAPEKRCAYEQDLYFREGWVDLLETVGSDTVNVLHNVALLTVKPDAIAGRRLQAILGYAADHGFSPAASEVFSFGRHSMREVWRYDWHVYPVDRLEFSTYWYGTSEVALFLFRGSDPTAKIPATVRLSELKGVGNPALRTPTQMRSVLKPPNQILNFVHVGDEPADIVRELAIFFDRATRRLLLERLTRNTAFEGSVEAADVIDRLERKYPQHDLSIESALNRLAASGRLIQARKLKEIVSSGQRIRWVELCDLVPPETGGPERWDFIVVASAVLHYERASFAGLLPAPDAATWARWVDVSPPPGCAGRQPS